MNLHWWCMCNIRNVSVMTESSEAELSERVTHVTRSIDFHHDTSFDNLGPIHTPHIELVTSSSLYTIHTRIYDLKHTHDHRPDNEPRSIGNNDELCVMAIRSSHTPMIYEFRTIEPSLSPI